jgi:metal-responsive CopG/Arc/MetJ family transcriptional regulator
MPTSKARVQVTIDEELAGALDAIDPAPASRSRLIRDLALRGADAVRAGRAREAEALSVLLEIADGTRDYDLAASAAAAAARADRLA